MRQPRRWSRFINQNLIAISAKIMLFAQYFLCLSRACELTQRQCQVDSVGKWKTLMTLWKKRHTIVINDCSSCRSKINQLSGLWCDANVFLSSLHIFFSSQRLNTYFIFQWTTLHGVYEIKNIQFLSNNIIKYWIEKIFSIIENR